jgi:hypothetical protein
MRFSAVIFIAFLAVGVDGFSAGAPKAVVSPKGPARKQIKNSSTKLYEATAAAVPAPGSSGGGTATISNEIFNLVKGIVGAGVLSLPAGMCSSF